MFSTQDLPVPKFTWNCNYCILDFLPKLGLNCLLHFQQNHCTDFLGTENFDFIIPDLHLNVRLPIFIYNFVGQKFDVSLHLLVLIPESKYIKRYLLVRLAFITILLDIVVITCEG